MSEIFDALEYMSKNHLFPPASGQCQDISFAENTGIYRRYIVPLHHDLKILKHKGSCFTIHRIQFSENRNMNFPMNSWSSSNTTSKALSILKEV